MVVSPLYDQLRESRERQRNRLNTAWGTLLVLGILMFLVNGALYPYVDRLLDHEFSQYLKHLRSEGTDVEHFNTREFGEALAIPVRQMTAVMFAMGVVFIWLAVWAKSNPLRATSSALLVFVGVIMLFGLLSPISIGWGALLSMPIVPPLVVAIIAAYRFQREKQRAVWQAAMGEAEESRVAGSYQHELRSRTRQRKRLNTATGSLVAAGSLVLVVNVAAFPFIEASVNRLIDQQIKEVGRQGYSVNRSVEREAREAAVALSKQMAGVKILLGGMLIAIAAMLKKNPVTATRSALLLYVSVIVIFGVLDPMTIVRGVILKIPVVIALIVAIVLARDYQREKERAERQAAMNKEKIGPVDQESVALDVAPGTASDS